MILYKYRGFANIEYALDIFINKRLWAAKFEKLNDPMEGLFFYDEENRDIAKNIMEGKQKYGILSLSENFNNYLMWSYYSESHTGFVVGVEVNVETEDIIEKIDYDVKDFSLSENTTSTELLLRKYSNWRHEEEFRVLKNINDGNQYISVEIKELIFGFKSDSEKNKKELLITIAKKFCPDIEIKTISYREIEQDIKKQQDQFLRNHFDNNNNG